jgi:hypothetical protein
MIASALASRQDFAARPRASAADALQSLLLEHQRDDGHWTDEWASRPATAGPVGVTAAAVIALLDSGLSPATPEISRAVDWLWGRTVAPAAKDSDPPEAESLTALTALLRAGRVATDGGSPVLTAALRALREMQNDDGGWAMSHDVGQIGEASDARVTGDVLTVLGMCGVTAADAAVRSALAYFEREQDLDSGWGDLAATAAVLAGLRAVGVDARWLPVRRAAEWVRRTQLAGGNWAAAGEPVVAATASAILALHAAGDRPGPEVAAGVSWLTANPPNGSALAPLIAAVSALGRASR